MRFRSSGMRRLVSGCFWTVCSMHGWSWKPELCSMPGGPCWVASLTLSPGGDKMGVCRWVKCCADQGADGSYRCLVVSGGSAWLGEAKWSKAAWCCPFLQLLQKLYAAGKFSLWKNSLLSKRKGKEKMHRNFSPRSKASANFFVFCKH